MHIALHGCAVATGHLDEVVVKGNGAACHFLLAGLEPSKFLMLGSLLTIQTSCCHAGVCLDSQSECVLIQFLGLPVASFSGLNFDMHVASDPDCLAKIPRGS
jgi:hypothetical protein